jgi:hypothetical protein
MLKFDRDASLDIVKQIAFTDAYVTSVKISLNHIKICINTDLKHIRKKYGLADNNITLIFTYPDNLQFSIDVPNIPQPDENGIEGDFGGFMHDNISGNEQLILNPAIEIHFIRIEIATGFISFFFNDFYISAS